MFDPTRLVVKWVYDHPHEGLIGQVTTAVIVRFADAETGKVDLQAFRLNCHTSFLVKGVSYSAGKEPGTWHYPGE